jgi:hypothetical protein
MPTKRSGKGSPVEPKPTYAEWRGRCAALLESQGISAGFMREITPAATGSARPHLCAGAARRRGAA